MAEISWFRNNTFEDVTLVPRTADDSDLVSEKILKVPPRSATQLNPKVPIWNIIAGNLVTGQRPIGKVRGLKKFEIDPRYQLSDSAGGWLTLERNNNPKTMLKQIVQRVMQQL